jgi:hypothetical protein
MAKIFEQDVDVHHGGIFPQGPGQIVLQLDSWAPTVDADIQSFFAAAIDALAGAYPGSTANGPVRQMNMDRNLDDGSVSPSGSIEVSTRF